jgi:hypothetical protein
MPRVIEIDARAEQGRILIEGIDKTDQSLPSIGKKKID